MVTATSARCMRIRRGFFGENRGCKVVWQAQAQTLVSGKNYGPGLFTDPCSGAHFDRTGALVDGPADRDLDYFPMTPEPDGFLVDTRTLLCGDAPVPQVGSSTPQPTATPTPSSPRNATASARTRSSALTRATSVFACRAISSPPSGRAHGAAAPASSADPDT